MRKAQIISTGHKFCFLVLWHKYEISRQKDKLRLHLINVANQSSFGFFLLESRYCVKGQFANVVSGSGEQKNGSNEDLMLHE